MTSSIQIEKPLQPTLAKYDPSILDLVLVLDCTSSMCPYITSATDNIRLIGEEIIASICQTCS